ncbi:hypothetical protein GCM10011365_15400 [Marinicella pacifica]|uniref:Uncharacterized protein n=1 Tax=Marinicella pacifica TaxID=1171543 RepID=A0A917CPD1_9GAMM|nr:hypothetical protein GCM10011365_15400 [Marinicella pacifica]
MKPPVCEICQKRLTLDSDSESTGGLVWFKNYQPLPPRMVGHPKGIGWFCGVHYKQAQTLNNLDMTDAIQQIKSSL